MRCPVHGEVEGYFESEGALGNAYPYPVLCEKCPLGRTIIGYENEHEEEVDSLGDVIGASAPSARLDAATGEGRR